jgi:hypothetical protein
MDAAHLAQLMLYGTIVLVLVRSVVITLDKAETGFASLFVPPDRTLGWPHGVQEGDEPWAWRAAPPTEVVTSSGDPGDPGGPSQPAEIAEPRRALVVPVGPVAPVHLGLRPH